MLENKHHWRSDFPQRAKILEPYLHVRSQNCLLPHACSIWSRRFYLSFDLSIYLPLHEGHNFDWKSTYGVQCKVAVFREIYLLYDHEKQSGMPFPRSVDKRAFTSDQEIHRRHNSICTSQRITTERQSFNTCKSALPCN